MIACYLFYMDTYMQMDRLKLTANWVSRIQKGMSLRPFSSQFIHLHAREKKTRYGIACLSTSWIVIRD